MVTEEMFDVAPTANRQRVDHESGRLVGSRCGDCGTVSWPSRALCHRCGALMDLNYQLPDSGTLRSYARVWVARPGLPTPYWLGQVSVDGCLFFGRVEGLDESVAVPIEVSIRVGQNPADTPYWFEPLARTPEAGLAKP